MLIGCGWVQAWKYKRKHTQTHHRAHSQESVNQNRLQWKRPTSVLPRMLKMRLIFAVCFCTNFLALIVNCTQTPNGNAECSCNEMTICQGIKTLEKKLEDLTALVIKTAHPTPQPTPPGKLAQSFLTDFLKFICCGFSNLHQCNRRFFIFYSAGLASSCKELFDKNK